MAIRLGFLIEIFFQHIIIFLSFLSGFSSNQERVNQVSDILLVDCSLRIANDCKILSLIKFDPIKIQVSNGCVENEEPENEDRRPRKRRPIRKNVQLRLIQM